MTKQSKSAIAFIISVTIMLSTFVFAGAVENDDLNAETVGTSDAWSRTVEFDKYVVVEEKNTATADPDYFQVVDDPNEEGDKYLHYYNHSGAGSWAPNWSITPTPTGVTNTNSDAESGQVLPTGSTFKMTYRVRINSTDGGSPSLVIFYGYHQGRHSSKDNESKTPNEVLKTGLTASEDWQTITVYFTTPDEYSVLSKGVANRFYTGLLCAGKKMDYDLDYIKIEKVVPITYDANGGTFSDGSTTKTLNEVVGAEFTADSPIYPGKGFYGWSLDADGGEVLSKVEAAHSGNTLYAVWGAPGPHPADGNYDSWSRTVEFDKYEVVPEKKHLL